MCKHSLSVALPPPLSSTLVRTLLDTLLSLQPQRTLTQGESRDEKVAMV